MSSCQPLENLCTRWINLSLYSSRCTFLYSYCTTEVHYVNIKLRKLCFAGNILLFVLLLHTFDMFLFIHIFLAVPQQLQRVWPWFWWDWQTSQSGTRNATHEDIRRREPQSIWRKDHRRRLRRHSMCHWEELRQEQWRDCRGSFRDYPFSFGVWVFVTVEWQRLIFACTFRFSADTRLRPGICPFFSMDRLQELGNLVTWRSDVVVPSGWLANEEFGLCYCFRDDIYYKIVKSFSPSHW